jgi:SAM-dependent methyltransferase
VPGQDRNHKRSDPAVCPLCGSGSSRVLYRMSPQRAGALLIPDPPEQRDVLSAEIARLWQQQTCSFHGCRTCGFGFAWPFLAGDPKIYSLLYYRDFSFLTDKWEYSRALEILGDHPPGPESTLLELGAGNGSFLYLVSRTFPGLQHIYSTEASRAGAEQIREKGFQCFSSSLPELKEKHLPAFDVICMFQVLEHMDDLDNAFKALQELGRDGSDLIISVPNGRLRIFYDRMGVHLDVPPVHVGRFTPHTFRYLADKYGWELKEASTEPQTYLFKARKFIFTRYRGLNLARKIEASRISLLRNVLHYATLLVLAARYLPVLLYLLNPGSGTSLLVHLKKKGGRI